MVDKKATGNTRKQRGPKRQEPNSKDYKDENLTKGTNLKTCISDFLVCFPNHQLEHLSICAYRTKLDRWPCHVTLAEKKSGLKQGLMLSRALQYTFSAMKLTL